MTPEMTPEELTEYLLEGRCKCGHKSEDHLMRYSDHLNYVFEDQAKESCKRCYWDTHKQFDIQRIKKSIQEIGAANPCKKFEQMDNLQFLLWKERGYPA